MGNIIETTLSGLIMCGSCYYIWKKFLGIKYKIFSLKFIIPFLLLSIALFFNYYFNVSYFKIIVAIVLFIVVLRLFFVNDIKKAIIVSIVLEIIFFVSELLFSIIMLVILNNDIQFAIDKYFGTFLTNFIICTLALILSSLPMFTLLYNKLLNITHKIKLSNVLLIFAILIISFNVFLMLPYYQISTVKIVLFNAILIAIYSIIVFKFIEQKNRLIDISSKYSMSETSLKDLQSNVNRLMTVNHENNNQLVTIRTMVANKDKNVLKNIDVIIDRRIKDDKDLKIRTSVIYNTMLGSLVYSKLLTMKENNIKYNLHIDKALNKTDILNFDDKTNVDICKIIGIYLDNAIEATNEINEKEVNIELYTEDKSLYIVIANTFEGNVDLSLINNYGYTTKGNNHGYGLSLVKEVIRDNSILSSETEIIDSVFIQKLKIKM